MAKSSRMAMPYQVTRNWRARCSGDSIPDCHVFLCNLQKKYNTWRTQEKLSLMPTDHSLIISSLPSGDFKIVYLGLAFSQKTGNTSCSSSSSFPLASTLTSVSADIICSIKSLHSFLLAGFHPKILPPLLICWQGSKFVQVVKFESSKLYGSQTNSTNTT